MNDDPGPGQAHAFARRHGRARRRLPRASIRNGQLEPERRTDIPRGAARADARGRPRDAGRSIAGGRRQQPHHAGPRRGGAGGLRARGQTDPARGRAGRRIDGRRRRTALGRMQRPRRRPFAGLRRAVQRGRRSCSGRSNRREDHAVCRSRRASSSFWFPRSASTRRACTPPGTSATGTNLGRRSGPGVTRGSTRSTDAALAVEPRLARWRDALRAMTGPAADLGRQRVHLVRRSRFAPGLRHVSVADPGRGAGPSHPGTNRACGMGRDLTLRATYPPGVASGWP